MSYYFENQNPAVMANGFNTNKAVSFGSTISATGAMTSTSNVTTASGTDLTYGGSTTAALLFSSSGLGIYFGSGAPTITAAKGSIYTNATGTSSSTRLYVNYGGTAGWNSITTSA